MIIFGLDTLELIVYSSDQDLTDLSKTGSLNDTGLLSVYALHIEGTSKKDLNNPFNL